MVEDRQLDFANLGSVTTPMMQQYAAIKAQYPDCLLFFRLGDFYEMFFNDAIEASKILSIALTKRGKQGDQDIPMCGVPFHSADGYIHKLIESGYKVAICEQIETPEQAKKRGGAKEVVRREVIRVITPGTICEDNLLVGNKSNYLAALAKQGEYYSLAWVDISTREFGLINTNFFALSSDLSRINPRELLISESLNNNPLLSNFLLEWKKSINSYVDSFFEPAKNLQRLKIYYQVSSLDGIGEWNEASIAACGAIIEYLTITQKNNIPKLEIPKLLKNNHFMIIDSSTRQNLEITSSSVGTSKGSLLSIIDFTLTNLGARLLNQYLAAPLVDAIAINKRLDLVEYFFKNQDLLNALREVLATIPDLERALSRLALNKGGPRDLLLIRWSLIGAYRLAEIIEANSASVPERLLILSKDLVGFDLIIQELENALNEEVGVFARDGGFVKLGYNAQFDELKKLGQNSKYKLEELKLTYQRSTGISNLKISHNNVIGYFIEVTAQQSVKLNDDSFIHRQTLANNMRYTTLELKAIESDLVNLQANLLNKELEIFSKLLEQILNLLPKITLACQSIAVLDVVCSLAKVAKENNYVRPIVDHSLSFNIEQGRHPVIEANLFGFNHDQFVANNCCLEQDQKLWLLTGPNMAGKSTFLRQNALIAILAQIGSFVPAKDAHIGIIDRIFSRVGAADDLARGRSTFMVEMVETATILNQATSRSLIIVDEIGRGTSTYDGVSIALSCLEYIHDKIDARSIFATHYHELADLTENLSNLKCYNLQVKEWEKQVIFMHKVVEGCADKSYGIHVAQLAGLPKFVISRAEQILLTLSNNNNIIDSKEQKYFLSTQEESQAEIYLQKIEPDQLTPREALEVLYKVKALVK